MLPVIQIGPLAVQPPGLILLAGLWLGISLAERHAPRFHAQPNLLLNLIFVCLISGLAGSRLVYALRYWSAFSQSPLSFFSPNPGLLDPLGGLLISLLAGLIYGQRKHLRLWPTLDALTPALAVAAIAIGLAHLASGTRFGEPTILPWGIELWGARRHPTQIYESLFAAVTLVFLWPGRSMLARLAPGVYFLTFMAMSAAYQLFIEGLRADSSLLTGGLRTDQAITWVVLAACLWLIYKQQFQKGAAVKQDG